MLPQLISAAVIGALSPAAVLATIVLLGSRRPVANVLAALAGWSLVLVALAAALLALFGGKGAGASPETKGAVELVLGILLLGAALRTFVGGRHALEPAANPEKHAPAQAPAWLHRLDSAGPLRSLGFGAVLIAVSPADLTAFMAGVHALGTSDLDGTGKVIVVALLVVAIDLCILIPLGVYLAIPDRADRLLAQGQAWIVQHQGAVAGGAAAVFGVLLVGQAVGQLT